MWFYGVMVSTSDSESGDPSSNLGRTSTFFHLKLTKFLVHSSVLMFRFNLILNIYFNWRFEGLAVTLDRLQGYADYLY